MPSCGYYRYRVIINYNGLHGTQCIQTTKQIYYNIHYSYSFFLPFLETPACQLLLVFRQWNARRKVSPWRRKVLSAICHSLRMVTIPRTGRILRGICIYVKITFPWTFFILRKVTITRTVPLTMQTIIP